MREATLIYPHQLFSGHPGLLPGRPVYIIEEPLILTENGSHTQKLLLHRLSMKAYAEALKANVYQVTYFDIQSLQSTADVFALLHDQGINHLHIVDTTDCWLERHIAAATQQYQLTVTRYESPLFLLPKAEAIARYKASKKHMARFYKQLRIDKNILLTDSQEPLGGKWSFDDDNQKKLPKNISLPSDITAYQNDARAIQDAITWLNTVSVERYGECTVWLPWTTTAAQTYLMQFLEERLCHFGDYEDALDTEQVRLFHSSLSPLINIGLLTPAEVIHAAIHYGEKHEIPMNNIEGFVRQVIGWREFIRASYECDGVTMRTKNFWNHKRLLPTSFWNATTGIPPVDNTITKALAFGYNHHIERLMVLGNFMLLRQTHPDEVYRWFMAMYVDAYDWVMVPNVYGMSQFADGGIFATKPYISGSNYLKKMSNYSTGEWETLWTALYWNFIVEHQKFFSSNHRLSMMPKLFAAMPTEKQHQHLNIARSHLETD